MPASSNTISSTARSEPRFAGGGAIRPLTVVRVARARRMRLAVDPRDGAVRLTLPPRAALAPALEWAESQREWIEAALARLPEPRPFVPGASFPFEGEPLEIAWAADAGRTPARLDDCLRVGGPEALVAQRVLRWVQAEARARLEAETRALAHQAGVAVGRVRVGDARTRWGSCSAAGDIAYSWRLILAPPEVRRATVAHEVAHRLHMDHSPAFHAVVLRLFGRSPAPERAWLKANGAMLHGVGRGR